MPSVHYSSGVVDFIQSLFSFLIYVVQIRQAPGESPIEKFLVGSSKDR